MSTGSVMRCTLISLLIALMLSVPTLAKAQLIDPEDGWFDTTQMLAGKAGFLPVPIIITEPALEGGAGAALIFLHSDIPLPPCDPGQDPYTPPVLESDSDTDSEDAPDSQAAPDSEDAPDSDGEGDAEAEPETDAAAATPPPATAAGDAEPRRMYCRDVSGFLEHVEPPVMSGVFGGGTGNESYFAGAMHSNNFFNDYLRYTGVAAYSHINLKFYGAGNDYEGEGVPFNTQGFFTNHTLLGRLWDIPLFVGLEYLFLYTTTGFGFEVPPELGIPMSFQTHEGGLGFRARLDYRDNALTPNRGLFVDGKVQQFGEYFGGVNEFTQGDAQVQVFLQPWEPLIFGFKLAAEFSTSNAPFYMLPSIDMRGITLLRYQGEIVLQGETEIRFQIVPRVGVVAFFGAGQASNGMDETDETSVQMAGGGGLRYLLARGYGLHGGVDLARGPDSWTFHITIGQSWGGL